MTAKFSAQRYADLLAATLPQIIESEAEYELLLTVVEPMMSREADLSPEEVKLFDLLMKLIQDYEEKHYPIEPAPPHQVLQHLLEARGLVDDELLKLAAQGKIRLGEGTIDDDYWKLKLPRVKYRGSARDTLQRLIDEERGEQRC